ncbi:AMP-binding protein [Dickeya poaceiphila]|uniref:D-alanine--poly(Phosphoribitol) ligase n=1 Tax=Dickeya poaceiphila TaxID=568768 RepID=A0A5B8IJ46_9GAMM|nr:AMP-binding protein [Dickeya poaceiphila]QDX31500.1 D-alanine--poly(phosphoribitol) ligase [Dickeya poaceiphila]
MSSWSELIAIYRQFQNHDGNAWQCRGDSFNYVALFHRACDIALFIQTHQQESHRAFTPVLVYGHRSFDFLAAWWACLLCGCAVIPVEADNSRERLDRIANTTGANLLINTHDTAFRLKYADVASTSSIPTAIHRTDEVDTLIRRTEQAIAERSWHGLAYIMFSSGTTGEPKGIPITVDNLADFVRWIATDYPLNGPVTGNVRYCFDVSLFELWLAWSFRQPISILDYTELVNTRKLIAQHANIKLSCWVSTPSIVKLYLMDKTFNQQTLPYLNRFMFCGETLTKEIVASLWERFPDAQIINTYGPTECTVAVTAVRITPPMLKDSKSLPIGSARPGTAVYLERTDDATGYGEIVISGTSVGAGYLNAPPERAANFSLTSEGRTYRTGDIGTFDGRYFYFIGRHDKEVKIQGYRIDLHAIEHYLLSRSGISAVIVEPYCRKGTAESVQVFVAAADDIDFSLLAEDMREHFPTWSVPRYWYRIADIQLNNNGKLDRQAVKQIALESGCKYVSVPGKTSV